MSTNDNGVSKVSNAVPAGGHADAVQERVQELRRWREQIPRFLIPATSDATQRLSSAGSVTPAFVEQTNVAVANQTVLVRTEAATPAETRDMMAYAEAYEPLADELEALAHIVRHSVAFARNRAGNEALTRYALARRLAKLPENAALVPYVADMRRALGRMRKPTPEEAARRAAERAAKAAARAEKKARKVSAQPPDTTQPSS